jgi:hypothetical protein
LKWVLIGRFWRKYCCQNAHREGDKTDENAFFHFIFDNEIVGFYRKNVKMGQKGRLY